MDFPFVGIVSNLEQQFLLFHATGQPLRATLKVVFLEFLVLGDDQKKTDPELTTRVVRRGDSLASIAPRSTTIRPPGGPSRGPTASRIRWRLRLAPS